MIKSRQADVMVANRSLSLQFLLAGFLFVVAIALAKPVNADASREMSIEKGRAIAEQRNAGNCYSCHAIKGAELPGNYGPPLFDMKTRYPDRAVLKAQIFDARVRNANTPMPPYGAHLILTDSELESVVDYIHSL